MKDETYVFISDVKEKGITARSARHTRTHCGKGGRVRFPTDNLSKKELQKMNGECKSYRLNDPMDWKEFKSMPDDLKVTYIKLLRKKFNVPGSHIAKMFGISEGKHSRGRCTPWDKEGFYAWWQGVDKPSEPAIEEPIQEETEEPEAFMEEDLPFEEPHDEPDPIQTADFEPVPVVPVYATPVNGSMNFKCPADQALNTLAQILGNANCAISIMWKVIEEGGAEDA